MKKTILSLLCLLAAVVVSAAQTENGRLGVRLSWDLNSPATNMNRNANVYNNGSGFSIGAFYDINVNGSIYFEPALSFYYNTIGITEINSIDNDKSYVFDGSLRNVGFRIPMLFAYRFEFTDDIAVSAMTGPQLNVGLSLKEHYNFPSGVNIPLSNNKQLYGNGWHRLDLQWMFGVRFHYRDNFFADILGGPGMTNIMGGSDYKGFHLRRNIFTIGVGYIF